MSTIQRFSAAIMLIMPLMAQHEQTPINIDTNRTVRDANPTPVTFNNYSFTDLKVENTFGATERYYTASGTAPGYLKTITINKEWATLKATPCTDSTFTSCAGPAAVLSNGASVTVDSKQWILQQFHFHAPSEHTVDGQRYPMEIHFVHLLNNGCAADDHRPGLVVGAFIAEGTPDPEINRFFQALDHLPENSADKPRYVRANLSALLPAGSWKWRYDGGLTAPAGAGLCGFVLPESIPGGGGIAQQLISGVLPEVVHWYLYDKPIRMSKEQIARFRELYPEGNARPIKENESAVHEAPAPPAPPVTSAAPVAVAAPKNISAIARTLQLDGTQSTSGDGKALAYLWTLGDGSPSASILNPTTATPQVQFSQSGATYRFVLTVTDSTGRKATDTAVINYFGN